jgi:hypothetical protein
MRSSKKTGDPGLVFETWESTNPNKHLGFGIQYEKGCPAFGDSRFLRIG